MALSRGVRRRRPGRGRRGPGPRSLVRHHVPRSRRPIAAAVGVGQAGASTVSVQWTWMVPAGLVVAALVVAAAWWWGRRTRTDGVAVAHSGRLTELPRYRFLARRHRRLLVAVSAASLVLVLAVTMLAARPVR